MKLQTCRGPDTLAAVADSSVKDLKLVIVPYLLLTVPDRHTVLVARDTLKLGGVEFAVMQ